MNFSIGIEEEYQVINPVDLELCSHDQKIVLEANKILDDQAKGEMHQAVVEVGTKICKNIYEAREQVRFLRKTISEVAGIHGLKIAAAGTHPFSKWENQSITDHPRYKDIVDELQDAARSNLVFGLHVHVGIDDKELAVQIANSMRYFLPHVFALSTNSPFWEGRNTGFKSFRTKVFDKFPRTGIPVYFDSLAEYEDYINLLVKTNCIDNAKKIWWDIRVHPFFPTIEIRICDVPMTVDETLTIAALIQAIVAKLYKLRAANLSFVNYKRPLINENKWRACRYGIDGNLIDFGKQKEVHITELIHELLDFVDEVVDDLGSRAEINYVNNIIANGTGADRQLDVYNKNKSLQEVTQYIIDQTMLNVLD